jgi:hypothetical protein
MTGSTDETGKNMDGQKHGERQFAKSFAAASFFAQFRCQISAALSVFSAV